MTLLLFRFVMLCKITKNPVLATKLLSQSGKCKDLLEVHPEVIEYFYFNQFTLLQESLGFKIKKMFVLLLLLG